MGACLMAVYVMGVYLMSVHLMAVYFMGVCLTSVHLTQGRFSVQSSGSVAMSQWWEAAGSGGRRQVVMEAAGSGGTLHYTPYSH